MTPEPEMEPEMTPEPDGTPDPEPDGTAEPKCLITIESDSPRFHSSVVLGSGAGRRVS